MKILLLMFTLATPNLLLAQTTNPNYDSALAKKVQADEYGMKNYVFVILKSGENTSTDKKYKDSCFDGHLKNMKRLAASKQLIVAGPFAKNENDFRGLFILNVGSIDDANKLLETDPAIKAGFLSTVMIRWYCSAALPEYLDAADKVWKIGF